MIDVYLYIAQSEIAISLQVRSKPACTCEERATIGQTTCLIVVAVVPTQIDGFAKSRELP